MSVGAMKVQTKENKIHTSDISKSIQVPIIHEASFIKIFHLFRPIRLHMQP